MDDHVEHLREQWAKEMPDLNTEGMAILGRARWLTLRARPQIEAVFARHGLDSGTFDVLAALRRAGPPYQLRPTELYRTLMISSGGMTDRLNRLEARALLRRVRNQTDGRSVIVALTDLGRELVSDVMQEDMAIEAQLIGALPPADRKQLALLLAKLASLWAEPPATLPGRGLIRAEG